MTRQVNFDGNTVGLKDGNYSLYVSMHPIYKFVDIYKIVYLKNRQDFQIVAPETPLDAPESMITTFDGSGSFIIVKFDVPTDRAINSLETLDGASFFHCHNLFDFAHFRNRNNNNDVSIYQLSECVWLDDSTIHMKRVSFINPNDDLTLKANTILKAFCTTDNEVGGCHTWPHSIINNLDIY